MPTGGGKSLLFMLPAAIGAQHGGTTVVVVPLVALRQDMKQRCDKMEIKCVEWSSSRPADGAAVVLVTPESAVNEAFMTFLNRSKAVRQLDQIVIDECHVVLNQMFNFRKELHRLGRSMTAETQIVLLTATLPPSLQGELWMRMGWQGEEMKMFRDSTARKNARRRRGQWNRLSQSRRSRDGLVIKWIQREKRHLEGTAGKIIVYCNTVGKVKNLADILDCPAYYYHQQDKEELLTELVDGQYPEYA
ncbi:hypothetical protein LTR17_018265 [Elasticomyces elasticus]|nr:hypothetical protein LTR17_018265 [Elasticomyces elasticus]